MAPVYDGIMTQGYYDYDAIARDLDEVGATRVLELGVGTGLVLEHLLAKTSRDYETVAGVDVTRAMLDQARDRLLPYVQTRLYVQDVTRLDVPGPPFDLIFSYGGPWYFIPDGDSWAMISHLREGNVSGLAATARHLAAGGRLLLGIQAPHRPYFKDLGDGTVYAQDITPIEGGFRKEYTLTRGSAVVMRQVTDYRMFRFRPALTMLDAAGLRLSVPARPRTPRLFLEFGHAHPR
jgi:SAM-dependent methyltransferase